MLELKALDMTCIQGDLDMLNVEFSLRGGREPPMCIFLSPILDSPLLSFGAFKQIDISRDTICDFRSAAMRSNH